MNKVELTVAVQKTLDSTKADAERAVNAVIDGIKLGVKKNKDRPTHWIRYFQNQQPQSPCRCESQDWCKNQNQGFQDCEVCSWQSFQSRDLISPPHQPARAVEEARSA